MEVRLLLGGASLGFLPLRAVLKRHAHAVQREPALVHGVLAVHRASHAVQLALDRGPASLLDSAGGAAVREQEVDVDRVFDAATVHAVLRLLHHGRVRRELREHHGRGSGEVHPHAARGDAHQRHAAARVVAEPVHGFAALRGRRRAFQPDEALHQTRAFVRVFVFVFVTRFVTGGSPSGEAHVRGRPARGHAGQAVQDLVRDAVHDVLVVREDDHLGRRRRLLRLRRVPVGGGARLRSAVLHEEHLLEPLDRAGQLHERGVAMARHRRASRRASRGLLQRAFVVALAARLAARLARLARLAVAVAVAASMGTVSRRVDGHHLPPLRG